VTDTGLGMDETTQSQIFEPFFTTKELGKGTGLGLATVFGIVQQSGGHIWVYSELNEGTTFKVYLPEDAEPERQTEEPPEIPHQRSDHGKTVLVVEDEEPVRRLAVRALSRRGYNVLDAADARTALGIVRESDQVVDLIITDVVMPGMSGVEFGKEVDAVLDDPPPIIYMSGYTEHSLLQQVRLNKKNYLQKPFNPDELVRMVSRTIDGQ
jgi:CheY-like chemotaxis protein